MIKKFIDGLVYGSGFALAFTLIWMASSYLIWPMIFKSQIEEIDNTTALFEEKIAGNLESVVHEKPAVPFKKLNLKRQVEKAKVIFLVDYTDTADGKKTARIKEILKITPGCYTQYKVGDELPASSYYPKTGLSYGSERVVFFVGDPPVQTWSASIHDGKLPMYNDLSLESFRKLCQEDPAPRTL